MRILLKFLILTFLLIFKAHSSIIYLDITANKYFNTSGIVKVQNKLNQEDLLAYVMSTGYYSKPENVQYLGEEIGLIKYCPGVSSADYSNQREAAIDWLRLGSTKFEKFGQMGFLNQRKFSRLLEIFSDGEKIGARDARLMRRNWKYRKTLCPELLNSEKLRGPSSSIMSKVPRN